MTGNNTGKPQRAPMRNAKSIRKELLERYGPQWEEFAERWLSARELDVLKRRFKGQTQREAGIALGLSGSTIGNIEGRALRRLRYGKGKLGLDSHRPLGPTDDPNHLMSLGLWSSIEHALMEHGIETVQELLRLGRREVLAISGIGPTSLKVIEARLGERGLSLAPEVK